MSAVLTSETECPRSTSAAVPPSPAAVVTIARKLEIAAHALVERAVRRVREKATAGQ